MDKSLSCEEFFASLQGIRDPHKAIQQILEQTPKITSEVSAVAFESFREDEGFKQNRASLVSQLKSSNLDHLFLNLPESALPYEDLVKGWMDSDNAGLIELLEAAINTITDDARPNYFRVLASYPIFTEKIVQARPLLYQNHREFVQDAASLGFDLHHAARAFSSPKEEDLSFGILTDVFEEFVKLNCTYFNLR